jgi:hypothetical protein
MTDDLVSPAERQLQLARERADELKGFFTHLGVFFIVILGLFFIDLASGPEWWFFYPAIAWGVALAIHGMTVGVGRLFDEGWAERKAQGWVHQATPPAPTEPEPSKAAPTNRNVISQSGTLIDQMRQASRAIPKPEIRQQALGLCASADMVLSAIEENPNETALASDFLDRYLTPASTIITGYSRLANRNIPSARPTLEKIETHDLKVLSTKVDEIYDRLHRGNLIDVEVAREMLSLDVPDWEDTLIGELEASSKSGGTT